MRLLISSSKISPAPSPRKIGEPLDAAKISESLKRLYATGRFAELRAEGAPEGDGVSLTFVARAQYFIGIVTAEGNPGPVEAPRPRHRLALAPGPTPYSTRISTPRTNA